MSLAKTVLTYCHAHAVILYYCILNWFSISVTMASRPCKVWSADRQTRKSLMAKTLTEVFEQGRPNV